MDDQASKLIACIPRLRRYARALVGDRAGADDLVQDTLERAWNKISSWRHDSDMRPWLFSIMHNLHIDQKRKFSPMMTSMDEEGVSIEPQAVQATDAGQLEMRDMESALRLLPAEQREILLLVALEDMSYEEVAATLHIPLGTVMSRLSRGREKLRALMEGHPGKAILKVVK